LLELLDVWFSYPGMNNFVLRGVSLRTFEKSVIGIIGENGVGKTTLLHIMAGLLPPTKGTVLFMGKPLSQQLPKARRHIGLLFQNPEFMLFNPSVKDEVSYTPRQICSDLKTVSRKVNDSIKKVGLPPSILDRQTYTLSYGEKKLVALASIISYEPKLLLLDEPFSSLSRNYVSLIKNLVKKHKKTGGIAIITSLNSSELKDIADNIYILEKGVLKELF